MQYDRAIEGLKKLASSNAVAKTTFLLWSIRERGRSQVTIPALALAMKREGFTHTYNDYASVLKALSDLGLGHLQTTQSGRILALIAVKFTLQSIGLVALKDNEHFVHLSRRKEFRKVPNPKKVVDVPIKAVETPKVTSVPKPPTGAYAGAKVDIVFVVNGKPVRFHIPDHLDMDDIAVIVDRFKEREVSK